MLSWAATSYARYGKMLSWAAISYGVKKYTTIIKLSNLEEHARAHNTQQTPIFVTTFYVITTKMEVISWLIYGLWFL